MTNIPEGALVLLVGPAGCGKSTHAARHFPAAQVLSSDAFRALVADDATDQDATSDAFRILHAVARARLKRGRTTVIDATNLTPTGQRPLVALAQRAGRPLVAIVFATPLERCLAQNAARTGRVVPDAIVRLHHAQLPAAVESLRAAGATIITVAGDPAAGSAAVGGEGP